MITIVPISKAYASMGQKSLPISLTNSNGYFASVHYSGSMIFYEQYLRESAVPKEVIDVFLAQSEPTWSQFDSEVGYRLGSSLPHDGLDGSWTISSCQANGARTARQYTARPCRINTYGNSFTQCHQVSDGETWQEYLAAHLGEPVRNFGMGGYGVYQAYRRMIRTERSPDGVKNVVFYLWGDDHCRSIMRCRYATIYRGWKHLHGAMFHANFWANLELDFNTGQFVEKENLLATPESLYRMTDPAFLVHALRDDLMVQLYVAGMVDHATLDLERLNALADLLQVPGLETGTPEQLSASAYRLRNAYGFAATRRILDLTAEFCRQHGKKLLVVLFCPTAMWELLSGKPRYDQTIADYLNEQEYPYFDMNLVHLRDFQSFNLSIENYLKRYFIGHYSPAGNHFFAYSIKDTLVQWLNPKPITYRDDGSRLIDFEGYLPSRMGLEK